MVRINKVYTRTGDKGETRLAGGQVVAKTSPRITAYGTVDELNACLGLVAETTRDAKALNALDARVRRVQNELFDLGSQLAVLPVDRREGTPVVTTDDVRRLEDEIDEMNAALPKLESFILPGGGEAAVRLHLARTVCRRAEREVLRVAEAGDEPLDGTEVPYLNRLSDWLFVASRWAADAVGVDETLWRPGER